MADTSYPDTLQPEHATHLLQRQNTLQHEAQTVLDELNSFHY